jgi:hypothetical protein
MTVRARYSMLTWWTMPVPGGDHLEVVEGGLAPAQELVALTIALVLDLHVAIECGLGAEGVDLHGVVDHEFGGSQGVHAGGVATHVLDGLTHGGQVDDTRNTGEVLHDHTGRGELDLDAGLSVGVPVGQGLDVLCGDVGAVLGAEQVLQQHLEAVRQLVCAFDSVQTENFVFGPLDVQYALGTKAVHVGHGTPLAFTPS